MRIRSREELLEELDRVRGKYACETGRPLLSEQILPTVRALLDEKLSTYLRKYIDHLDIVDLGGLIGILSERTQERAIERAASQSGSAEAGGASQAATPEVAESPRSGQRVRKPRKGSSEGPT